MTELPQPVLPPSGKKIRRFPFFRILLAVLLLALAVVAGDALLFLHRPAGADAPQDVIIDIKPGATFDRVAWDLYKAGAISDVPRFRLLAQYQKRIGSIQAGEFVVNTGWKPTRILQHLVSGQPRLHPLTLREGLAWWEVARRIEAAGFATAAAFEEVIHDRSFLAEYAIPFANAEGFLFPDTYLLKKPKQPGGREEAEAVARILIEAFWKRTWPLWTELAQTGEQPSGSPLVLQSAVPGGSSLRFVRQALPVTATHRATLRANATAGAEQVERGTAVPVSAETLRRILTLATLVEKETGVADERARVAGVYANRLRLGMLLQCDPTIIYGIGPRFSGSIRKSQLADAGNVYNTYQHPGLPPGPICSPGFEALRAAAFPETHRYLFFVATGVDARHVFSTNVADHNKAVARYRQAVRNAGQSR